MSWFAFRCGYQVDELWNRAPGDQHGFATLPTWKKMEKVRLFYCVWSSVYSSSMIPFTAFTYLCPKQILVCGHVSIVYFLHSSLTFKMRKKGSLRVGKLGSGPQNRPSGTPSRRFPLSQCQTRPLVCTWGTCGKTWVIQVERMKID